MSNDSRKNTTLLEKDIVMTSLTMLVSLFVFVLATSFAYNRYGASMLTAAFLGLMGSVLVGGSMQPGFFAEVGTFNFLGVAAILAPIVALEFSRSSSFTTGNKVLLSRETYAGLNMRNATPLRVSYGAAVRHAA